MTEPLLDLKIGQHWRHNASGRVYRILGVVYSAQTSGPMIRYQHWADNHLAGPEWVRPIDEFLGYTEDKRPRFTVLHMGAVVHAPR